MATPRASTLLRMVFLLVLVARPVWAAGPQISVEGGESYVGGYFTLNDGAPAVFAEAVFDEHGIGSSRFTWAPDVTAGWIDGRDIAYFRSDRYTTRDHIWLLAAGLRFHYGDANAWYRPLFFSFQPTLHTGRTPALSSSYEFTSTLGWQCEHWMVALRHSSNAYLHMPNRGENLLLMGVTF
jgi:hypothetical protein